MMTPGETTATVVQPRATLRQLHHDTWTPNGRTAHEQNVSKHDLRHLRGKVIPSESTQHFGSHGLRHLRHFSSDSPVRFMIYSEAAASLISLHSANTVCLYDAHGHKRTISAHLPFMGLTATKISGCIVGWGPGAIFTLLDSELNPLDDAPDGLDIRVCQAAEHSTELVTAGAGNVCVWSVMLMRCKLKIQEGLEQGVFTRMALAPPRPDRHHRAFVACGQAVMVVDLDDGKVLTHKKHLCSDDITAMVYCVQLDCVIIASKDGSIKAWSLDLEPRGVFSGHKGVANSLFYCSESSTLLSSTEECTICRWNVKEFDLIECIHTEQKTPLLYIGGTRKGDTFFSYSSQGVDIWTFWSLYSLHCQLAGDEDAPLRQILVTPFPVPYPTRILCVSGDYQIALVSSEAGEVLTSFRAKDKILCADYCLHKEILLALTEAGTVLQANTLTNPITLMQEWRGRGQGPWQQAGCLTESDGQKVEIPGPACCLVLYNSVTDTQRALDDWRDLQDRRGCSQRNKKMLDDVQNKFLIILGQSGGCMSVLKMNNGKVMCRMPAHNGQKVTRVQAYPENSYLFSSGEDQTVVVWRVNPYVDECLTPQLSLHCGPSQGYFAALGPQLALTFQDPKNHFYALKHFNLLAQSQTDQQPQTGHLDRFTGLCVFPEMKVFVSSSLDKTLHIWNEKNHLIRTLQLNTVPECLGHSGFGGELYLGIKGDLHKMNFAKVLRGRYKQTVPDIYCAEPPPDLPIPSSQRNVSNDKQGESQSITKDPLLNDDTCQEKDRILTLKMDLEALVQGTVTCKKGKPPSTSQTRKEAFERYLKIIYGLSPIKSDMEDIMEPDIFSLHPRSNRFRPRNLPRLKVDVNPPPESTIPDTVEKNEKQAPATIKTIKPVKKVIPKTPQPQPVEPSEPKENIIAETDEEMQPEETIPTMEEPKPKTPARPRTTTPLRPREPSPELPTFLKQFEETDWLTDLYPDKKSIPSLLSPDDFSLQLLSYLQSCSISSRVKILSALQEMHSQGLFRNTDRLYQGLIDSVHRFARPHMAPEERLALAEMLNLLVRLKPPTDDLIKMLLTLLAHKNLGLRETVLRTLSAVGVREAGEWLCHELEGWATELKDQTHTWASLQRRADCWLEFWISKFKEHNRYLYLRSTAKWKPLTLHVVDVLNYFCSVQKEEHKKARSVAPAGRNDTVLLPLYDCSYQPILRLGETHTMARIRRSPGSILPPLRNRPSISHFPPFIIFPLPRVTLSPFHIYSDEDWVKAYTQRNFVLQESWVENYR